MAVKLLCSIFCISPRLLLLILHCIPAAVVVVKLSVCCRCRRRGLISTLPLPVFRRSYKKSSLLASIFWFPLNRVFNERSSHRLKTGLIHSVCITDSIEKVLARIRASLYFGTFRRGCHVCLPSSSSSFRKIWLLGIFVQSFHHLFPYLTGGP